MGLAVLGLAAYWGQFAGLEERLLGYTDEVARRLEGITVGRFVVRLGMVDSPEKGLEAGHQARREDIDVLVVYVATYGVSAAVLPLIQRAKVPLILLNVQPGDSIDYARLNRMESRTAMTGEWLAYCGACPVPEIANVLRRLGIGFEQLTGTLDVGDTCWVELEAWMRAAEVVRALARGRLGLMGHYYGGMLDIATDLAMVSGRFGLQVEMVEVDELTGQSGAVGREAIAAKVVEFREFFDLEEGCETEVLERSARTAVALERMIEEKRLDLMAYFYKGVGVAVNAETMDSIILGASMLTGNGVPVAGEYEVKNAIAMKILDLLGHGGSFTEYYAVDFAEDVVLMGHDGPGHVGIAEGRIKVRPLGVYHGKTGSGLSVEMSVQHGPVTLLSVVEDVEDRERGFLLLMAEGESVAGPVLEIGNTNSRYRFAPGAKGFLERWNAYGPAHHCAIGIGHVAGDLKKVAMLLGMRAVQVC